MTSVGAEILPVWEILIKLKFAMANFYRNVPHMRNISHAQSAYFTRA